ncbi:hypothetical protein [Tenacibaculum ascidiaceicola]|uniref:hypothetical protein n=1 Tax=Tenacibaculum ascidiaceicola TaxID=1699411 RepID=UPI003CE5108A
MKKRNKQIANLLKLGVFLFGFSLLLWNCQDETLEKQENNIATVGLEEALNLFKANSSAKLHTITYFVAHLEKIHQEDIINSEERLTIIPVSTKDSGYYSRILLLKVNGNIQSVIFSMYPSSTKNETNGFTGEIIITDLEGNFLKGYRANSGNLITKFTKKVLSVNKSSKGGVCPDHGECTANSLCVYCTQELDEVVVSGNTSGGSAPVDYILDFSGTGPDDGSSGDPNTSMGWDYGDGGGGNTSNSTQNPCNYIKLQIQNPNYTTQVNELKSKTGKRKETGYKQNKDGTQVALTDTNNGHSLNIPVDRNTVGYMHTHINDYNTGRVDTKTGADIIDKPIKMFSPADIIAFLKIVKFSKYNGVPTHLVYGTMISSTGSYTLRFTGNIDAITGLKSANAYEADYKKYFKKQFKNNPEKAFLHFLKDFIKINGINLYRIRGNGDIEQKTLNTNGKVDTNDCE